MASSRRLNPDPNPVVQPQRSRNLAQEQSLDLRNTVRQAMRRAGAVGPTMSKKETEEIMRQARGLSKPD